MCRKRAGLTLGLALIVVTIAMGFAAVVVGTTLGQLHMIGVLPGQLNARCMSDSLLALAIERVQNTRGAFGDGPSDGLSIQWSHGTVAGALSFTPGDTSWSTNNVKGDHPNGWLRHLPQGAVHLVGVAATTDGYTHTSEALVYQWPYPYALSSNGPIVSNLGLMVGAVQSSQYLQNDITKVPASQQAPGNIATNSSDAFFAMAAGTVCHITGDAQACGGITVPPASVDGAVQTFSAPVPLPSMDVTQYKPAASMLMSETCSVEKQDLPLEGFCEAPNGLTETGNIMLNSGVLYVDGDLVVNGAIFGQGAVFATGSITINGGTTATNLKTDSYTAMAAQGNISLIGNNRSADFFAGIIYCGGNLVVQHITLQGSCVNNSPNPNNGIQLTDATLVAVPEYTHLAMQVPLPPPPPPPSSGTYPISGTDPATGQQTMLATVSVAQDGSASVTATDPSTGQPVTTTYPPSTVQPDGTVITGTQQAGAQVQGLYNTPSGTDNMTVADQQAVGQPFPGPPTPAQAGQLVTIHSAGATSTGGGGTTGGGNGGGGGGSVPFALDYNTFITFGDQMHLLMWRDVGSRWQD